MKIEILSIGNEVLCGDIVNTNAAWLSEQLWKNGFDLMRHTTIADDEAQISNALLEARGRSDALIATGGLGPTVDDFTVEIAAKTFGLALEAVPEVIAQLDHYYTSRGRAMTPNQRKQALIPQGGEALINPVGSAPGVRVEQGGVEYFFLPGVPKEMKEIFQNSILPWLLRKRTPPQYFKSKTLRCFGAEEAKLDHLIQPLLKNRVGLGNAKLAFRVAVPEVLLKVSTWGEDEIKAQKSLNEALKDLKSVVGEYVYGEDEESLESVVLKLLAQKKKTLALAESCTGGLLSHRLTNIPGSSHSFKGGIVAYSNEVKITELGVLTQTLEQFGAVSGPTALEMAEGVRQKLQADLGIAITGIAGPEGGSQEKPVGTVHIALSTPEETREKKFHFPTNREWFKLIASSVALNWLRKHLSGGA